MGTSARVAQFNTRSLKPIRLKSRLSRWGLSDITIDSSGAPPIRGLTCRWILDAGPFDNGAAADQDPTTWGNPPRKNRGPTRVCQESLHPCAGRLASAQEGLGWRTDCRSAAVLCGQTFAILLWID